MLIINKNDIKQYQTSVKGSDLKEFIAITLIDARMEVVGEVFRDIEAQPLWMSTCIEARIVKKIDRNRLIIYTVMNSQWPAKDRDIVIKNDTMYDLKNGKGLITFEALKEPLVPLRKDRVRITELTGSFKMEYLGRDKTKLIYRQMVNPGGDVPLELAYLMIKSNPYQSLLNLKKIVKNAKYSIEANNNPDQKIIDKLAKDEKNLRETLIRRLSRYVENENMIKKIITEDKNLIKNIIKDNGAYRSIKAATKKVYQIYMSKLINNESVGQRLINNEQLEAEIIEMIHYDYGDTEISVDSIARKYIEKYARE